jgi:hypothetical protein
MPTSTTFKEMAHYSCNMGGCIYTVRAALFLYYVPFTITDDRNIPALGRIGDVDDIIASVLVEDGKVRAKSKPLTLIAHSRRSNQRHINLCHRIACAPLMVSLSSRMVFGNT